MPNKRSTKQNPKKNKIKILVWNLIERKTDVKLRLSRFPDKTLREEFRDENKVTLAKDEKSEEKNPSEVKHHKNYNRKFKFITKKRISTEASEKTPNETLTAACFSEMSVFGGFKDGLICCWNLKVIKYKN